MNWERLVLSAPFHRRATTSQKLSRVVMTKDSQRTESPLDPGNQSSFLVDTLQSYEQARELSSLLLACLRNVKVSIKESLRGLTFSLEFPKVAGGILNNILVLINYLTLPLFRDRKGDEINLEDDKTD
jgi:hypothetical protein